MSTNLSESILQKRIKRFKSIKRGYYSLIAIISLYILSLLSPLWVNDKPLMVGYANNQYDKGEKFEDLNYNDLWDIGEPFNDKYRYFFPAIWDLLDFIPGISYPIYESKYFNQNINKFEVDFRLLDKSCEKEENGNFVIMPLYPYHPHEDLKDELDEIFEDINDNGIYDMGEPFVDQNEDGQWTQNNPPTKPDGFGGRHLLGTDNTGRDVFARVVDGFKVSITFAVICTFLSYSIGIIIGGTLGYYGSRVDLFGVRIMEIFSALPFLFIVMILSGFMQPNLFIYFSFNSSFSFWMDRDILLHKR